MATYLKFIRSPVKHAESVSLTIEDHCTAVVCDLPVPIRIGLLNRDRQDGTAKGGIGVAFESRFTSRGYTPSALTPGR